MGNPDPNEVPLARRLGLFDATMIVMGGIIGAGIFVNPAVVARHVHTPLLVLGAWLIGGMIGRNGGRSHHLRSLLLRTIRSFHFRTSCRYRGARDSDRD